jgi:hypothetical protein
MPSCARPRVGSQGRDSVEMRRGCEAFGDLRPLVPAGRSPRAYLSASRPPASTCRATSINTAAGQPDGWLRMPAESPRRRLNAGLAGGPCPGQAQFKYPATFVLSSTIIGCGWMSATYCPSHQAVAISIRTISALGQLTAQYPSYYRSDASWVSGPNVVYSSGVILCHRGAIGRVTSAIGGEVHCSSVFAGQDAAIHCERPVLSEVGAGYPLGFACRALSAGIACSARGGC